MRKDFRITFVFLKTQIFISVLFLDGVVKLINDYKKGNVCKFLLSLQTEKCREIRGKFLGTGKKLSIYV